MEKLIGYIFVGGTLVLAAADGALALLIVAAICGGGAYVFFGGVGNRPGFLSRPHQKIYEREKLKIQAALDGASKEEKEEIKRLVTAKLDQLQKTKTFNEVWDKKIAAALGVAVFASPAVCVGLLGYVLYQVRDGAPMPEFNILPKGGWSDLEAQLRQELQIA